MGAGKSGCVRLTVASMVWQIAIVLCHKPVRRKETFFCHQQQVDCVQAQKSKEAMNSRLNPSVHLSLGVLGTTHLIHCQRVKPWIKHLTLNPFASLSISHLVLSVLNEKWDESECLSWILKSTEIGMKARQSLKKWWLKNDTLGCKLWMDFFYFLLSVIGCSAQLHGCSFLLTRLIVKR